MELEALQETAADIKSQGASLVVISPQLEKYSKLMANKHKLTFPLLTDENNRLASQFGLTFKLPDDLAGLYSQFGIDLVRFNGNDLWSLPIPGRFILDQKGNVVSAEANPDYTHRPEPSEIVKEPQSLVKGVL
jgi:peroxiredoxin